MATPIGWVKAVMQEEAQIDFWTSYAAKDDEFRRYFFVSDAILPAILDAMFGKEAGREL
jgi:hypothetical protein